MTTIRFLLLFAGILIGIPSGHSQDRYKPGYAVTSAMDTIYGLIKDGSSIRNTRVCLVKLSDNSGKQKLYAKDLASFRIGDSKYYRTLEVLYKSEYIPAFTEVLIEGRFGLYYFRKNKEMAFYLRKPDGSITGLMNREMPFEYQKEVLYKQPGGTVYLEIYKDTLYQVFSESKRIQDLVDQAGYNRKSLLSLTHAYVKETCKDKSCLEFVNPTLSRKPVFSVYTGIHTAMLRLTESNADPVMVYSGIAGVSGAFPAAFLNDLFYLQAEILMYTMNSKINERNGVFFDDRIDIESRIFGIPLALKYRLGRSLTAGIGKEMSIVGASNVTLDDDLNNKLRIRQTGKWFCETGISFRLNPVLTSFVNLRIQSGANYNYGVSSPGFAILQTGIHF